MWIDFRCIPGFAAKAFAASFDTGSNAMTEIIGAE